MTKTIAGQPVDSSSDTGSQMPGDLPSSGKLARRLQGWKQWLGVQSAVPLNALFGSRRAVSCGILMYHRIVDPIDGVAEPTMNVTPERLEQQLTDLLARGYQAWPLSKLIECWQNGEPLPKKTFVVTFDDAFECVYLNAWPVLKKLKVPGTIFLATAYLDSEEPFPFDDWSAVTDGSVPAETWRALTTSQCREMAEDGLIELGTHTHTHSDFRGRADELQSELVLSTSILAEEFGISQAPFALPWGNRRKGFASPEFSAAAERAGVTCCLSTESELITAEVDPFDWGRFTAESCDTGASLAAKLNGWYTLMRSVWRRMRRLFKRSGKPNQTLSTSGATRQPRLVTDKDTL